MNFYALPEALTVGDSEWEIRTDYRDILNIISAFDDPNLEPKEQAYVCLLILYKDFDNMPESLYSEAFEAAMAFIDNGKETKKHSPRTLDWEQDAPLLFPAVNKVAGFEVRAVQYMHWWTFMGLFMEIQEGVFSTVLSLRSKKAQNKKLEKWEREWWNNNLEICKLKQRYSDDELEEQKRLKALLG